MATDYWPEGDGLISEGYSIGFFYADSTSITAGQGVIPGSSAASRCAVTVSAGIGDGFGVALKTPVAVGDIIPVLILGVYKFLAGTNGTAASIPTIGKGVMNSHVAGYGHVCRPCVASNPSLLNTLACFAGASYILGIALQSATVEGDEILVLVGRW